MRIPNLISSTVKREINSDFEKDAEDRQKEKKVAVKED